MDKNFPHGTTPALESDFIALVMMRDRHVVWANRAAHRILGYQPGELIGLSTRKFYPDQASYEAFGAELDEAIRGNRTYTCEVPQQLKDGRIGWFEFNISRLEGQPDTLIGAIQDRTNEHRTLAQLEVQSDLLSAIRDCVSIVSTDGIIRYTNAAFNAVFGYQAEELIGKDVAVINAGDEDSRRQVAEEIMAALLHEGDWQGEVLNRSKDGREFWTSARVSTHLTRLYGPVWISIQRDITARKQAHDALRVNEERLELALAGTGLALWDWDIAARKVFGRTHWHLMLGRAQDELGEDEDAWLSLIHPNDMARFQRGLSACLSGDTALFESEHRLKHKDGHWVQVEAKGKVSHRAEDGAPLRMVGTVLDITSRKRLSDEGVDLLKRIESLISDVTSGKVGAAKNEDGVVQGLSRRQRQTVTMIAKGMSSVDIAKELKISTGTAISHRRALMKKLGLHNAAEVTRFALRHRLTDG